MDFLNTKAKDLKQGAIRAMFDKAAAMNDVISMGIGEPDMDTPALVCEAGMHALTNGDTHYTPNAGTMELRKAIAEKSNLAPLRYNPEKEIIITNGGMGALSLLFLVILNEGDEVLIQDPQWLNYVAQVKYCGGVPVRVPTDAAHNFTMQPEVVEGLITSKTKALMINSPNNPTGEVVDKETLEKLAEIAKKYDLLLISDEVYNTLIYDGVEFVSVASLPGMKERTVVINSFSKSYAMTGWRVGYAAGPEEIIDRMTKCQENFNACVNAAAQHAAAVALDHPEEAQSLCGIFAKRREVLLNGLNEIDGFVCNQPMGAFYIFADIRAFGMSSAEFCNRLLEEEHVVCIPGSAFGEAGEGYIRIAYTNQEESLKEAVKRIHSFCDRIKNN